MSVRFGRAIVGNLATAETREWLVTNGIGGYGSGTIAGSLSRGYHGLLVAATKPPVDRRIVLVKLDEAIRYHNATFELGVNRWAGGTIAPSGHHLIESFELERSVPRWRYICADAVIDKQVWMEHGANTTYIAYTLVAASGPLSFSARAIVDNRVFHNTGMMNPPNSVQVDGARVRIEWSDHDAPALVMGVSSGHASGANEVYRNYQLPAEASRGLNDIDHHTHAATFNASLSIGETLVIVASTEEDATADVRALDRRRARETTLLERWKTKIGTNHAAPPWAEQLVLAADQFVVARSTAEEPNGTSIIAGYHWFEDWGRDTMIALPGLTLSTGRPEIAAPILKTFSRFVSRGMLPNRFPDGTSQPEYNTIDATLWYFQAVAQYYDTTNDIDTVSNLFEVLEDIIQAHVNGTRFGIKVDDSDGLLRGGEPGVQLTWMDAKVGDWVVTPRIGKPVEVNALWYNALRTMERFAKLLGQSKPQYTRMVERALNGFQRFWNAELQYCNDVIDGPEGTDTALRPNQLLAVSLPESPLSPEQQKSVVDACARALLTSRGVRSLSPNSSAYVGHYGGDQTHRDSSYHQGTVWAWLAGPFITAHFRVYQDTAAARRMLDPLADNLREAGIGTISEIFDGDAPFASRGCIAQAWSVGEVLHTLERLEQVKR